MPKAEKLLQLPNGEFISYDEIFSPFNVYEIIGEYQVYVLQPLEEKFNIEYGDDVKNKIFIGNERGVTICDAEKSSKILESIDCEKKYKPINTIRIPQPIQDAICADLIDKIHYNRVSKDDIQ